MAAQGSVTLNTKVYVPRGNLSGISTWALVGDVTFGGATSTLTQSVRGPTKEGINRVQAKIVVPKAATTDSACSCAGSTVATAIFNAEVVIPQNFTAAERLDLKLRLQNWIASAVFGTAVENLEPAW